MSSQNQINIGSSTSWSPFSAPLFYESIVSDSTSERPSSSFQYSCVNSSVANHYFEGLNPIRRSVKIDTLTENKNINNVNNSNNYHFNNNNNINKQRLPKRSAQVNMNEIIQQAERLRAMGGRSRMCTFCKTNGESEEIYTSHSLKDTGDKITCPILLEYRCEICGARGEKSHTKKYCPVLQKKVRLQMLEKLARNDQEN